MDPDTSCSMDGVESDAAPSTCEEPFAWRRTGDYGHFEWEPIYLPQPPNNLESICEFCYRLFGLICLPVEATHCMYETRRCSPWEVATCQICQYVAAYTPSFDQWTRRHEWFNAEYSCTVELFVRRSDRESDRDKSIVSQLVLRLGGMYTDGIIPFAIWSEEGTASSATITSHHPLASSSAADTAAFVKSWLDECEQRHGLCKATLPMTAADMPKRLLKLSGNPDNPSIRLVEALTDVERYCTLSHWYVPHEFSPKYVLVKCKSCLTGDVCSWGPPEKRPPSTTIDNLGSRLDGIDFNSLPKTFRESIMLTMRLGISFLWIDSLCIIQDSEDDWVSESKRMSAIYQGGTLMLGATESSDSTRGILMHNRPFSAKLQIPYIVDGVANGKFNMTRSWTASGGQVSPEVSTLRERAWAFQEWYLSPRKVLFTSKSVWWWCSTTQWDENSRAGFDLGLGETISWYHLVEDYSGLDLTYVKDRLPALEGIVAATAPSRQDQCRYGTWDGEIIKHLLWLKASANDHAQKPAGLPSWCWASSNAKIAWVLQDAPEKIPEVPGHVAILEDGACEVSAKVIGISPWGNFRAELPFCVTCGQRHLYVDKTACLMTYGDPNMSETQHIGGRSLLFNIVYDKSPTGTPNIGGLASFDKAHVQNSILLPLTKTSYQDPAQVLICDNRMKWCPYDAMGGYVRPCTPSDMLQYSAQGRTCNRLDYSENVEDVIDNNTYGDTEEDLPKLPSCTDWQNEHEAGKCEFVYWALMLEPVGLAPNRFRRVGVAMLYPHAAELCAEEVEIEIV